MALGRELGRGAPLSKLARKALSPALLRGGEWERGFWSAVKRRAPNVGRRHAPAALVSWRSPDLDAVATRIVNQVRGVNRVLYDVTSTPPGKIALAFTDLDEPWSEPTHPPPYPPPRCRAGEGRLCRGRRGKPSLPREARGRVGEGGLLAGSSQNSRGAKRRYVNPIAGKIGWE